MNMTKKQIMEWLIQSLEDLQSGHIDEMDIPELDLWETDREKTAFKAGMELVSQSLLNNI